MSIFSYHSGTSRLALTALPLAVLVPLAAPFSAQQAASLGLPEAVSALRIRRD